MDRIVLGCCLSLQLVSCFLIGAIVRGNEKGVVLFGVTCVLLIVQAVRRFKPAV